MINTLIVVCTFLLIACINFSFILGNVERRVKKLEQHDYPPNYEPPINYAE